MKSANIDLEEIARKISREILEEDVEVSSGEKEKQTAIVDQIDQHDLKAKPSKKGSESDKRLTDEAEDEEGEEDEEKDEEKVDPKPKPEAEDEEKEKGGFEVKPDEEVPESIKFDDVKKQINNLRAGGSLKDEDIASQLEDYFDKLGKAETKALYIYLSSVASILTGGTSGTDAPRPEDSGIELEIEKKKEQDKGTPIPGVEAGDQAPIIVGERSNNLHTKLMILETLTLNDDHRCIDGKVVKFGSPRCISDIESRISDVADQRDSCGRGTADRSSLNGMLSFLRQKLRKAIKVSEQ